MNYDPRRDNVTEISLSSLFARILRKWKPIVIWTLIAAAAVGSVMTLNQMNANRNAYGDTSLAEIKENLTATEITTVDQLYQRYSAYLQKSEDNQEYLSRSILMNMDPDNISNEYIEYLVTSSQADTVTSFSRLALDQEDYEAIAKAISTDSYTADAKYAYELVNISSANSQQASSSDQSSGFNVETEGSGLLSDGGALENQYRALMEISIKASDRDQCEAIAAIVEAAVSEHQEQLKASGVDVTLLQTGNNYMETVDRNLAEQQQNAIIAGSDLIDEYNEFKTSNIDSLGTDEKNYFDYLVKSRDKKTERLHVLRYIAIGGVIGLLVSLMVVIISYIGSSKFQTTDDVERAEGRFLYYKNKENKDKEPAASIPTMGVYVHGKKHVFLGKVFAGWADHLDFSSLPDIELDEDSKTAVITQRLKTICKDNGIRKLFLVGNYATGYAEQVRNRLQDGLKEGAELIVSAGRPLESPEDLDALASCEAALLIQGIGDVRASGLPAVLQVCSENAVPVIGTVMVIEN